MIERTPGLELGDDGNAVGRDPRGMTVHELRQLGHLPMTAQEALRSRCLDCCAGSAHEVRSCVAVACPAWPFRLGKSPWRIPLSDAEKARRRNLLAQVGKTSSEPEKSRQANAGSPAAAISASEDEATPP
jgi:hypothetical protein